MSREAVCISRRGFLAGSAATGAGFMLAMKIPFSSDAHADDLPPEINAWVVVNDDDSVTIRIARSEMGQGTLTGLAQLVAEELECDWDTVQWEFPTPGQSLARERPWGSFSTGGSLGIRSSHQYVREGGAAARTMLIAAAAKQWQVDAGECSARDSLVIHGPSGRTLSYGAVAATAATMEVPDEVTLKDPKDWRVAGKSKARLDTREKVDGSLRYGADLRFPGMLHAAIHACPVHGGTRKSVNASKAENMPGVHKVVEVGNDAVAVVADSWWQAKTALEAVDVIWETGAATEVNSESIDQMMVEGLSATEDRIFVGNQNGDAPAALKAAKKTITADYRFPM